MNSYIASATISNKEVNQDYITQFTNSITGAKGLVLADGIGSFVFPEFGSAYCAIVLKSMLENAPEKELDFKKFFRYTLELLKEKADEIEQIKNRKNKSGIIGTTLMCVVEWPEKYQIAYVGNGAIWHVRGNFTQYTPKVPVPWSAINLLNPHTVEENGREALYKLFSLDSQPHQVIPTVLEISKDQQFFGDLIIAGTDGLSSNDHLTTLQSEDNSWWVEHEPRMELLYNTIRQWLHLKQDPDLEEVLEEYVEQVKEKGWLKDDLSVGVIASGLVLQ